MMLTLCFVLFFMPPKSIETWSHFVQIYEWLFIGFVKWIKHQESVIYLVDIYIYTFMLFFVHATLWKRMGPICIYDIMNATCDCRHLRWAKVSVHFAPHKPLSLWGAKLTENPWLAKMDCRIYHGVKFQWTII